MQTIYIETTIPSYLAAHPSGQPSLLSDQKASHAWWNIERPRYALFTSVFVLDEASKGDADAARRRLSFLKDIPQLSVTPDVELLARDLIHLLRLPQKAVMDASHLSMSILHQMDYLLTWNCTHLANPVLQKELVEYCRYHDLYIPIICTPEALFSEPL